MCQSSQDTYYGIPKPFPKFAFPSRLSHRKGLGGEYVYGKAYFQVFPKACISQASFHMPKEFLWKRLPQAFPQASFHIGKAWGRNMERPIPKSFAHHRERGLGSVEKGLVPSLLSLRIPFPQPPTWG